MKIETISVGHSQTFNLGEYNSVKFSIELSAVLDDDDDPREATETLRATCKASIRESARPFLRYIQLPQPSEREREVRAARVERLFLGREVQQDSES